MITTLAGLPFYDNIEQQFKNRDCCQNQTLHTYKVPRNQLPAFAFSRDKYYGLIDSWGIIPAGSTIPILSYSSADIGTLFYEAPIKIYPSTQDGLDYIVHRPEVIVDPSDDMATYELPCGCYYIAISSGQKTFYSEIFCAVDAVPITAEDNLVLNGDFSQAFSNWNNLGAMTIDGNQAVLSGAYNAAVLTQNISTIPTTIMSPALVEFTIDDLVLPNPGSGVDVHLSAEEWYHASSGRNTFYVANPAFLQFALVAVDEATFKVSNISIKMIVGYEGFVTMRMANTCRGVAKFDEGFAETLMLDAEILKPEYGEIVRENENGDFENINSFARAFKKFDVSPMLLPECIIDTLSKANTYDTFIVNNGIDKTVYCQGEDDLKDITISNFGLQNAWQEPECYGLVDFSFEQTLAIKNACCDTTVIDDCVNLDEVSADIEITGYPDGGGVLITPQTPFPDNCYVELFVANAADCDAEGTEYFSTSVVVSTEEFNENGLVAWVEEGNEYCFKVKLYQTTCDSYKFSDGIHFNCDTIDFEIEYTSQGIVGGNAITVTPTDPLPAGLNVSLMRYSSLSIVADCDAIDEDDYNQYGYTITSEQFNATGITFNVLSLEATVCYFIRIEAHACVPASDSNKLRFLS